MLAKSKLNEIETLISQAIMDLEINREEFKIIVDEKKKYHQIRESFRNIKNKDDIRC